MQDKAIPTVSIILPCLNEEAAIPLCLTELQQFVAQTSEHIEIIIVDNGSTDASWSLLTKATEAFTQLRVVKETNTGYGNAYLRGFSEARAPLIVMADLDTTYVFSEIPHFIQALRSRNDFVIGNRFSHGMQAGSMPFHHRFIGNPVLSFLVRLFFNSTVRDVHCGMRGITRTALQKLQLRTGGMEFASEMVIRAIQKNLRIAEVTISYRPRVGTSKLRSFADGWRHLRFILLYSPLYLFLVPGVTLFCTGGIAMFLLYIDRLSLFGVRLIIHPMFAAALLVVLGYQLITFAIFAKAYATTHLGVESQVMHKVFRLFSIEKASLAGIVLILIGACVYVFIWERWANSGFGSLNEIKNATLGLTLAILGIQTISAAFMTSILGIREHHYTL